MNPTLNYNMGTVQVGGTPTPATTTDLNTFNQSMVNKPASTNPQANVFTGATSNNFLNTKPTSQTPAPVIVSNQNMVSKANDIVNRSVQLGAIQPKTVQTNQATTQPAQPQAIDYANAPYTTDQYGTKMYYNPVSGQYDQYQSNGGVVNYGGINVPNEALSNPYLKSIIDNQLQAKQANKSALDAQLESIKNRFIQYRDTQNKLNTSAQASVQNALLQAGVGGRGSVSQYAAATSDQRVNTIVEDGIQALKNLDNQEQELIAAANAAYQNQNFKILDAVNSAIEKKRVEQEAVAKELNKKIAEEQIKARQSQIQSTRDGAIADLYSQGITDPVKMLDYLNYDDQGNQVGDFTAEEIQKTMKNIATGLGTDVSGLDQTTKEFYRLKQAGGLPSYVSSLPTEGEQLLAYVRARTGAETKGRASSGGTVARVSSGGISSPYTRGGFGSDMDVLIAATKNNINSKFGQDNFQSSINNARNDTDKLTLVASKIVQGLPAAERTDFTNQTFALKQVDKAIDLLNQGVQTGAIQAGQQYLYNTFGNDYDPKLAKINQLIISAIQPYRNSITGAAWGDQEDAEYQNLFGSTKYSPAELKQRLEGVKEIMKDKTVNALRTTVDPLSQQTNIFETSGKQHVISKGDELRNIASQNGTTVDVLLALNPGINPNNLVIGSKLNLPIEGIHKDTTSYGGVNLPSSPNTYQGINLPY